MIDLPLSYYHSSNPTVWIGRTDGVTRTLSRWHQVVRYADLTKAPDFSSSVVLLGFCCDQGVYRNQGRRGASLAPDYLRRQLAGLPVHFDEALQLIDGGNIVCSDDQLEAAQQVLGEAIAYILRQGGFPILMGGGHEIAFGHYCGIRNNSPHSVGIVNIDAHFDLRQPVNGRATSGTGFYQIAQDMADRRERFHYMVLGIQKPSNSKALFEWADQNQVEYIYAEQVHWATVESIKSRIQGFGRSVDQVYLTIDLDAFAAPFAPGVSAVAYNGLIPDVAFQLIFQELLALPNLISVDIAELNPAFDQDNRTAKLGADLIFKIVESRGQSSNDVSSH